MTMQALTKSENINLSNMITDQENTKSLINDLNLIVAVGSIDGIAGTAACLRLLKNYEMQFIFTQAFQVKDIDVRTWPKDRVVGFIDLGVNNESNSPNSQKMTQNFVQSIKDLGHKILFIADEHNKQDWEAVLEKCNININDLLIKPENRTDYTSSCAILKNALGSNLDAHTQDLLYAGDQADQLIYTKLGKILNASIKSNMHDPERRNYTTRYMAEHEIPDEKIQGWINEYVQIEENSSKIFNSPKDLTNNIKIYDCQIGLHDPTSIFKLAYAKSKVVILINTSVNLQNQKQNGVLIGTSDRNLNLLKLMKDAEINVSGIESRVSIALNDFEKACTALKQTMSSN